MTTQCAADEGKCGSAAMWRYSHYDLPPEIKTQPKKIVYDYWGVQYTSVFNKIIIWYFIASKAHITMLWSYLMLQKGDEVTMIGCRE